MIEDGWRGLTRRLTPEPTGEILASDGGGRGEGVLTGRERHAGGKASRGWAAEGAANIV